MRRRLTPTPAALLMLGVSALTAPADAAEERENPLPNIDVIDQRQPAATARTTIADLPGDPRALPLSVDILDQRVIATTGGNDLASLIDLTTNALNVASEGRSQSNLIVRGFGDTPFYRNGMNDSLGQLAPRSLANVETVEILKGPDGALFGPGAPGGSINFVTKRPHSQRASEISVDYGRFNQARYILDSTGALPRNDKLQYRLIAEREQGDSFRDYIDSDRWFVMPALAWQPASNLEVLASVEYLREERLLDAGIFLADDRPRPGRRVFLGEPGVGNARNDGITAQLSGHFVLPGAWRAQVQLQGQRTRLNGIAVEPSAFDGPLLLREAQLRDTHNDACVGQFEIGGPALTRHWHHDLQLGVEAIDVDETVGLWVSDSDLDPFVIDPLQPRYGTALPALEAERESRERRRQYSLYARDLVTLDRHWRVLLAARIDHIDQWGHDRVSVTAFDDASLRLSPRAGVVYDSGRRVLGYASYSRAVEPNEGLQVDGRPLRPTLADAVETGLRWTRADQRLHADIALFGIRQTDVTVDAPGHPGFELQTARQENIGVDFELEFRAHDDFELRARYSWLDTKISHDPFIPDGTAALNAPKHQAGILALYKLSWLAPRDLSLALAIRYVGRRAASLDPEQLNLELDDYVRVDAFANWRLGRQVDLRVSVENLTDSHYIQGSQSDAFSLNPGAPLAVRGALTLRW